MQIHYHRIASVIPSACEGGVLRGDDHCFQLLASSTLIERAVYDKLDIGGDDHMGASATRRAAAVVDGGLQRRRDRWEFSRCLRAVDNDRAARKRIWR